MGDSSGLSLSDAIVVAAMAESELFGGLADETLTRLLSASSVVDLESGKELVTQGEVGDSFYLIQAGSVRVTIQCGEEVQEVSTLGPGSVIGEISLLCNRPRTATCTVASASFRALRFAKEALDEITGDDPELRSRLSAMAVPRVQDTMRRLYA
jgi:CRP/FNR family cyclic AMP-dependent transcriptional regulator